MAEEHFVDAEVERLRKPPNSNDAEQAVIGGLLLNNEAWDEIADKVRDIDFYRQDHQHIFKVMAELAEEGNPLDAVTVAEALEKLGVIEGNTSGLAYLVEIAKNTPSAANIKAYADIVRERSVLRQLIHVAAQIADQAYFPEGRSSAELVDTAERLVFEIAEQRQKGSGPTLVRGIMTEVVNQLDALLASDEKLTGVSTGFTDLDELTNGLQPADLVIVAGRPSMGKTTFAMNVAESVTLNTDKPVLVFSMEMPAQQLVLRMLSSLGRVDQGRMRSGNLTDEDWPRLNSSMHILSEKKLYIDDTPALSPNELRARARRVFRENGSLGLIMVDYLQLMQVPGAESRVAEISEISRSLKAIAKELNTPVVALSQLNRGLEQRPNKRPVMSDLRESGAIEQDADVIMFIYRDEVYYEDTPDKGIAEIIIGKQRNGPIGSVRLAFLGQYTRFDDLAPSYRQLDESTE